MKMNSVVISAVGKIGLVESERPVVEAGTALIEVEAVGVCGSDINSLLGRGKPVDLPLVIGHETVGRVISMAEDYDGIEIGSRVILEPYMYCGDCKPCHLMRTNCCANLKVRGVACEGTMSEYVVHPLRLLHPVPADIPIEQTPLIEPLVVATHALRNIDIQAGETLVVIGSGSVGLLATMAAKSLGATVIAVDIHDARLALALQSGADLTVNSATQDVVAEVNRFTQGRMADAVLEMSGSNQGIAATVSLAGYCARVGLVGWPSRPTTLDTSLITLKELTVLGCRNGKYEFAEAIRMLAENKISADRIISHVVDFKDLPETIRKQSENPYDYLKVVGLIKRSCQS